MKSLLKDPQSTCCDDRYDNGNSGPKDCLDKWKDDLEVITNRYSEEAATTAKDKEAYDNSSGWESKLKNWCLLIETTDEKVKAVIQELDFLLEQVKIVCVKSKCTYEVMQKLTCLVKSIFDCLYTYEENEQGLKDKIAEFKELIKCLKNLSAPDKAEVTACIEAYEAKITVVCDMQQQVLEKLLETLKCADLLWAHICAELGLEDKLEGIRAILNGDTSDDDDCDPEEEEDPISYPCDHKKAKPPPEFPIVIDSEDSSDVEGNSYYVKIKEEYQEAETQTKSLKDQWIVSKKISDKTLAEKESLEAAIAAAEKLDTGK